MKVLSARLSRSRETRIGRIDFEAEVDLLEMLWLRDFVESGLWLARQPFA